MCDDDEREDSGLVRKNLALRPKPHTEHEHATEEVSKQERCSDYVMTSAAAKVLEPLPDWEKRQP